MLSFETAVEISLINRDCVLIDLVIFEEDYGMKEITII